MMDGGPAFPQVGEVPMDGWKRDAKVVRYEGMSLRDWFAGMALQGILSPLLGTSSGIDLLNKLAKERKLSQFEVIADRCFSLADAMLQARAEAG